MFLAVVWICPLLLKLYDWKLINASLAVALLVFLAVAIPAWMYLPEMREIHGHLRRLRATRARRRGLCPTCGYDLRATPNRCPECGATV
jgi:hypothetical protein